MDNKKLRNLCEAYGSIYEPEVEITEEQVWEEVESWVESLLEEGYDLSDYTWEEMCEAYIEENIKSFADKGGALGSLSRAISRSGTDTGKAQNRAAVSRFNQGISSFMNRGGIFGKGGSVDRLAGKPEVSSPTKPSTTPPPPRPAAGSGSTPPPPRPAAGSGSTPPPPRPAAGSGSTPKVAPTYTPKPSTPSVGQTGNKAKVTPTSAVKSTSTEPKRTFNPLMQRTFGYQTGYAPDQIKGNVKKMAVTGSLKNSFDWGSNSKIVDDIANAYQSVYEAKKVDQDKDGDNDFADVRIARLIASGVSKEEAIRRVRNKSYNEEYGVKVPSGFSDSEALKGLIPKGEKVHDIKKKKPTLQNASYNPDGELIDEETEKEREERLAARRARVREMEKSGDVMTSDRRTRERAKQRKEEQRAERLERLANAALDATRGTTRRSSKPMGSGETEPKAEAPKANRRISSSVKNDKLASKADELPRKLQNEDFQLWVQDLLDEGYTLENWTDEELVSLYEEILDKKYGK